MNTIQIKRSSVAGKIPTSGQLAVGEFAVNLIDKKIFTKNEDNEVILLNPTQATVEPSVATPAGMVAWFATDVAPAGYIAAQGQTVSRSTFSALFMAIGTRWGAGDGVSTFKLPDLRGEFIRGADGNRGVDAGRTVGTFQGQDIQGHAHSYEVTHNAQFSQSPPRWISGIYNQSGGLANLSSTVTGGTETRPRNVAMLGCIKT